MRCLTAFLLSLLVLPSTALGQLDDTDLLIYSWEKETISHIEGVKVDVHHVTRGRAVDAENQIEADIEKMIRRSDLELYTSENPDPSGSEAELNINVRTNVARNEKMGYYTGRGKVGLVVNQNATLHGGQEITAETYKIDSVSKTVLSGRGRGLENARSLPTETAIVTTGDGNEALEVTREIVERLVAKFINDWHKQTSD